jgi:periplasmic protein TonB
LDEPVIFRDLPATFPVKNRYRKPSLVSAVVFHAFLILMVVIVPLLVPQSLPHRKLLLTLVSPIGPPPAPALPRPAAPVPSAAARPKSVKMTEIIQPKQAETMVAPTVVPKDVERIIDGPVALPAGVSAANIIPGGIAGGVLGGVLSATPVNFAQPLAPAPPTPAPKAMVPLEPVRVGGSVKEPRVLKMVAPVFPPLASRARVAGIVVLEAVVTAEGTVDRIRVVSGHPLLVQAAIDCVKRWQYEPTLLNGVPIPVILTAKVSFLTAPVS